VCNFNVDGMHVRKEAFLFRDVKPGGRVAWRFAATPKRSRPHDNRNWITVS
jgi:hypothetical protein